MVVTNRHVLNLMADNCSKCNRCIDLRAVHHLSTSRSAQEFVIHVSMEYDYHFKFEHAISTKFGAELSYGAPTLLDEVMAVLCSAVEAAKEPGAKLEVCLTITLTHSPTRTGPLYYIILYRVYFTSYMFTCACTCTCACACTCACTCTSARGTGAHYDSILA